MKTTAAAGGESLAARLFKSLQTAPQGLTTVHVTGNSAGPKSGMVLVSVAPFRSANPSDRCRLLERDVFVGCLERLAAEIVGRSRGRTRTAFAAFAAAATEHDHLIRLDLGRVAFVAVFVFP